MVKYFIYFHLYMVSVGDSTAVFKLGTNIQVMEDSLSFFVYDVGYVKWKIDHTLKEDVQILTMHFKFVTSLYFVSLGDLKAIVYINSPEAEIRILTGNLPYIIKLYN